MCGIVGILKSNARVEANELTAMRDSLAHRGPNDKGIWINDNSLIGLGHRRLSILDLSDAGHQPMRDEQSGFVIVFNGEIYNYLEIRKELKNVGFLFHTGTDTEVVLKAFEYWGEACLERFNGMFAFAIWQEFTQRLFIARDRLGKKPLYYYEDENGFYFASEVKAIRTVIKNKPSFNDELIDSYMSFGYVPGENTMLKGVKRLLPGHYLTIPAELGGVRSPQLYWNIDINNSIDKGENYYLEKAKHLLNDAINLRLRSDVPLGIFLSGGIDSSAVVGLLAQRVSEPLKTFSVAYDFGEKFNETQYARLVADKFKTDHHEIFITPDDFCKFIPQYIQFMDEPVTEAAAISLYYVSMFAKKHVTVVLSGEGSDEIFGGYDLYRYMGVLEKYYKIFGWNIAGIFAGLAGLKMMEGKKIGKYLLLGSLPLENRYKGISTYEERYKERLYNTNFQKFVKNADASSVSHFLSELFKKTAKCDVLSRMLYFDLKTWLVDDLLIKADRMSMAASLELRVPFLDYRLVEFAASIPSHYKIRKGRGKYLLKRMMENILPNEIIDRKKMGFPTPLKVMFESDLYEYAADLLLSQGAETNTYFRRLEVEKILREHKLGRVDHHRLIWQLVVLEQWMKNN